VYSRHLHTAVRRSLLLLQVAFFPPQIYAGPYNFASNRLVDLIFFADIIITFFLPYRAPQRDGGMMVHATPRPNSTLTRTLTQKEGSMMMHTAHTARVSTAITDHLSARVPQPSRAAVAVAHVCSSFSCCAPQRFPRSPSLHAHRSSTTVRSRATTCVASSSST
jgi:hypothetical protein